MPTLTIISSQFHCPFIPIYDNNITNSDRKSMKSIFELTSGSSYLLTRSPNISIISCSVTETPKALIILGTSLVRTKPELSYFSNESNTD